MKPAIDNHVRRIAMWSGPRNISTAMMRAWGSRADTFVCDEPFYAHYLKLTGYTHHPRYQEIISKCETRWEPIVRWLTSAPPGGKRVFYQKHMAHHLLPHIPLDWTDSLTNVFLIRDPREVLLSLLKILPQISVLETGLPQQASLFQRVRERTGFTPPVIDAKDVLLNPKLMLKLLCDYIEIPFDRTMLCWQRGLHTTDGIWAHHWYENTANSTKFTPYRSRKGRLPAEYLTLLQECQKLYGALATHRISPTHEQHSFQCT